MDALPVICRSCGNLFTLPNFARVSGGARVVLEGCSAGPCPNCGGIGDIPNGIIESVNDAVRFILSQNPSRGDLQRLTEVLSQAQREQSEPETLVRNLESNVAAWASLAAFFKQYVLPKNAGEFWTVVGAILTAVSIYISLNPPQQPNQPLPKVDDKQLSSIVEKAVTKTLDARENKDQILASKNALPSRVIKSKARKLGRNDRCPCNSGKKYKMCCINQAKPVSR